MDNTDFAAAVLPKEGYYCALLIRNNSKKQKFYDTEERLLHNLLGAEDDGYDAYYALATFKDDTSRATSNVHSMKSFFLDLDCGGEKEFVDQVEAITALKGFVREHSLPKPTIVSSGRGVHVYWPLEEAVPYDDWFVTALALKNLCIRSDFKADPSVTADGARVLRMPGTRNHKDSPPREVSLIGEVQPAVSMEDFSALIGVIPIAEPPVYVSGFASGVMDRLMSNTSYSFATISDKLAEGKGCRQLADTINNQADASEPMWRAVLSIAKNCVDGAEAIHEVSRNHPNYSAAETERKAGLIAGPYRCDTISDLNPTGCEGCIFKGKIGSPIVLGTLLEEAEEGEEVFESSAAAPEGDTRQYIIPKYPAPYTRGSNGGVYMKLPDGDGGFEFKPIYHNDIYVVRRMIDPVEGHCFLIRLHLPKDGVVEFVMNNATLYAKEEFKKQVGKRGVTSSTRGMDDIARYIMKWVEELQERDKADISHRQFGWTDENMQCFILGERAVFADRIEYNPPTKNTSGLSMSFNPKGTRDAALGILGFFNAKEFALHQIVIATAWGAPLMQLSSVHSALLHIHSEGSGFGKTTTGKIAAGIYGEPAKLITNINDTKNSRMNRMEVLKNLPMVADEISNWNAKQLSDFAYESTEGRQKNRMSQGGNEERWRGDDWRLLTVSTANGPFVDRILAAKALPKAEAQRVIELDVEGAVIPGIDKDDPKATQVEKDRANELSKSIDANYGLLGQEYIQFIINNRGLVRQMWRDAQNLIDTQAGLQIQNRFMSEFGTAVLTGASIAKMLGQHDWDMQYMFRALVKVFQKRRVEIDDMGADIGETLGDYLMENHNNVLRIESTADRRGVSGDKLVAQLIVPDTVPRMNMVARYETDTKMLYLAKKPLREWCLKHNINPQSLRADLRTQLGAKNVRVRMTKGTPMNLPAMQVIGLSFEMENKKEAT